MYFAFSEDQTLFRDAVRDLLTGECTPAVVRQAWDSDSGQVPEIWQQLAEQGVLGIAIPEAFGGLGMTFLDLVLLLEEAGRVALPSRLNETAAVAVAALQEPTASALAETWLPRIASGDAIVAVAEHENDLVCGAEQADLLLLRRDDHLYALTPDQVQCQPQISVDRSRRLALVTWSPDEGQLISDSFSQSAAGLVASLSTAATLIGLGRQMLDMTVEYAKTRQQFGVPIGSFQAIKHKLADVLIKLSFAAPVVYRAAYSVTTDAAEAQLHASMAKIYANDAADLAARTALQVHGAIGYTTEYDLHLWMKRAWALRRAFGNSAEHRQVVGQHLLGKNATIG